MYSSCGVLTAHNWNYETVLVNIFLTKDAPNLLFEKMVMYSLPKYFHYGNPQKGYRKKSKHIFSDMENDDVAQD